MTEAIVAYASSLRLIYRKLEDYVQWYLPLMLALKNEWLGNCNSSFGGSLRNLVVVSAASLTTSRKATVFCVGKRRRLPASR